MYKINSISNVVGVMSALTIQKLQNVLEKNYGFNILQDISITLNGEITFMEE